MIKNLLTGVLMLFFSLHITAQTQFENPGFEEWEPIEYGSVDEPVNWSSLRTAIPDELAKLSPAVWGQSNDAHTGSYSVYLNNIKAFGLVATGMVTSGRVKSNLDYDSTNSHTVPDDSRWNMPMPHRPDSVTGWYKGKPKPGDFPTVKVLLHTGYASLPQEDSSNWIGVAYVELSGTEVNTWTRFSTPFEYFNDETPEFMLSILTAGNGTSAIDGGEAWFDDLELIHNDGTSINELTVDNLTAHSSQGVLSVFIDDQTRTNAQLTVTDISGRQVFSSEMITGEQHQFNLNVNQGIYLVSVKVGSSLLTRKIYLR